MSQPHFESLLRLLNICVTALSRRGHKGKFSYGAIVRCGSRVLSLFYFFCLGVYRYLEQGTDENHENEVAEADGRH